MSFDSRQRAFANISVYIDLSEYSCPQTCRVCARAHACVWEDINFLRPESGRRAPAAVHFTGIEFELIESSLERLPRFSVKSQELRHVNIYRCCGCGWESLMKNVTLGNVTMSHRTRERPAECLASLSHSTMIGLPRAQH
ncbi:hypothetical protein EVAR_19361_1 [Eumeta japonica]|uniref:Uncharacterized protein n=1 Tax=Eumeta variegata TaxID=151549 RepID=A0A4C1TRF1_EUMVA|nr:hypothetical protein EVAR_19361_1 [Eumeta japonica]